MKPHTKQAARASALRNNRRRGFPIRCVTAFEKAEVATEAAAKVAAEVAADVLVLSVADIPEGLEDSSESWSIIQTGS